jgi:hypothetical protein
MDNVYMVLPFAAIAVGLWGGTFIYWLWNKLHDNQ